MANIAFVTSHYLPENTAAAHRVASFIQATQQEHSVSVFALGEKGSSCQSTEMQADGLKIYWVAQPDFSGTNYYVRFVFELYFSLKLLRLYNSKSSDFDRTVLTIPYLPLLLLSPLIIDTTKVILDCRDLVWRYLELHSGVPGFVGRCFSRYVKRILDKFNHITTTNEFECIELESYTKKVKVTTVRNGISREKFNLIQRILESSRARNQNKTLKILCCGNVGRALYLRTALQAVAGSSDFEFHVLGKGNLSSELEKEFGCLENVYFHGKKDWEEVIHHYQNADLLYLQVHPSFSLSMPLRLIEYLATGKKILFAGSQRFHKSIYSLAGVEVCKALDVSDHRRLYEQLHKMRSPEKLHVQHLQLVDRQYIREDNAKTFLRVLRDSLSSNQLAKRNPQITDNLSIDQTT